MQDDTPKAEDDFDDLDDLDFDDLDVEDDFDDESWEEFDEPDSGEAAGSAEGQTESAVEDESTEGATPAKPAGERTFLQKYFNVIVIGIAVLGGGGFILSQFGSAPNPQQEAIQAEAPIADAEPIPELSTDLPPQPAPIDAVEADVAASDETLNDIQDLNLTAAPVQDEALTPLPDLSADSADIELVDLSLEVNEAAPTEDLAADIDNALPDLALPDVEVALDANSDAEDSAVDTLQDVAEDASALVASESLDLPELNLNTDAPDAAEDAATITDNATAEIGLGAGNILEPVAEAPSVPKANPLEGEVQELQADLKSAQTALEDASAKERDMQSALSDANTQIANLQSMVDDLKSQLQKQETQQSEPAAETQTAAPEKAAPQVEPVKAAPVAETKPSVTKPIVQKAPAPKWTLRAAAPGQATLSDQNNDIRQIEVGDNVAGLGRIQSIGVENGKWVVKGSRGSVSQ